MKKLMMMAVAALCCAVMAEEPEPGNGRVGGPRGGMGPREFNMDPIVHAVNSPKIAEKLGLSDEQKAKLKELNDRAKGGRDNMKKVREAMMRQVQLMKDDTIDEAAVMKAIDEVFELRKQMAREQVKRLIEVKKILTPEQIAKAREEMKNSRGARRGPGQRRDFQGGKRGGRGPGRRGEKGAEPPKDDAE